MTRPRTGFPFLDSVLDQPGSVLAFAHRGGAYHPDLEGLENTLTAFQHAVDLGYAYLETDVHVTRDGTLLAFHDAALDRVTAHTGKVAELSYAEVAEAVVGEREKVPTMDSLLEEFPGVRFNIDLKSDAAVPALAELVRRHGAYDRVCVGSDRRTTGSAGSSATGSPRLPARWTSACSASSPRVVDALTRGRGAALQVPHRRGRLTVVTEALVARAHALGRHVHVWVVDEPDHMHELLDLGVDGLMTDRTDLLRDVLVARGSGAEPPDEPDTDPVERSPR